MNRATRSTATVLILVTFLSLASHGDGCFIWRNRDIDILQPSQKAIIEWDGKVEKLTIETKYQGPADEMVWIVPVPAEPEIKKADLRQFEEMSQWTQKPTIMYTRFNWNLALAALGQVEPLVSREKVGVYDVAVLAPNMDAAVLHWLKDNEFPVSDEAARTIADYDSRGWFIIAARVHPESLTQAVQAELAEGTLHPLAISFETARCVYPMKMTSLAAGPVEVLLWIKATCHYLPETLTSPEWEISFHGGSRMDYRGPSFVWAPGMWDPKKRTECITKLRRTFDPKSLTEDLYFKEADYFSFFDPAAPDRVAMAATQWGFRRDLRAIPLLADYLAHAKIEDKPHIRSVIWALGECSVGGTMPVATQDLLSKVAQTDAEDLGFECCVALEEAGSTAVAPILLTRMDESLTAASLSGDSSSYYSLRDKILLLADWFHKHTEDTVRTRYCQLLGRHIARLAEAVRNAPPETRENLDQHGIWLVNEAAYAQDASLLEPLGILRQAMVNSPRSTSDKRTIVAEGALLSVVLAGCQDASAKNDLLRAMRADLDAFEQKLRKRDSRDIVTDNFSEAMFAYVSDASHSGGMFTVSVFDCTIETAFKHLPAPVRHEMAVALLDTPNIGEYCSLYLLGGLTLPEAGHVARLKEIWQTAAAQEEKVNVPATLAIKVAELWKDAELLKWMLLHTTQLELKEQCLTPLLRANPSLAASVLADLAPAWNERCSAMNKYGSLIDRRADFFRGNCHDQLERAISAGIANDGFNNEYRNLCSDKALHPATRYYLLDLLGIFSDKRPAWSGPLVESLFDEVAAGVSEDEYRALVALLRASGCNKRLAAEWEATNENWKKDELTGALLLIPGPESARVLDLMLTRHWYEQFEDVANSEYDVFLERLRRSLSLGTVYAESRDIVDRVVRDQDFDVAYRACIVCAASTLSLDEMKEMLAQDLPDSIRASLQATIERLVARQPKGSNMEQ